MDGVRLQAGRCADRDEDVFFDSNFLVVSIMRLREVARMTRDRLRETRVEAALRQFDDRHPELRDVRDYQEHILDPELIGSAMYFAGGELVRLRADGGVEILVDPEGLAAGVEQLYRTFCEVLGPLPEPADTWVIRPPNKQRR